MDMISDVKTRIADDNSFSERIVEKNKMSDDEQKGEYLE